MVANWPVSTLLIFPSSRNSVELISKLVRPVTKTLIAVAFCHQEALKAAKASCGSIPAILLGDRMDLVTGVTTNLRDVFLWNAT